MLKVSLYSKAEIHLCNEHWVHIKSEKKPKLLSQPAGLVLGTLSQSAAILSGQREMRSGSQPGMFSPTSRAPQKNQIQAVPSMRSIPCQCVRQEHTLPKDCHSHFALTHLLHGTLVFIFANVKPSLWKDRSTYFGRHGQNVTLQTLQASFFTHYRLLIHSCKNARHASPVGFRGSFLFLAKTFHFISYHSQRYFDCMLNFISSIVFIFKISILSEKLSLFLWLLIIFKSE